MKICTKCEVEKPAIEFHKRTASKDGLAYWCKPCMGTCKTAFYVANVEELRHRGKVYRIANKEAIRQRKKKYYDANPEANRQRSKLYRQKVGPERKYLLRIKREYGLTKGELSNLKSLQNNRCALCNDPFSSSKTTHIDHIHGSNPVCVRGILCNNCNVGLGYFKDSTDRLLKAVAYLKKFQK